MKLEIYVVTTNISLKCERDALEQLKVKLCEQFGGLTVIPNCTGYWLSNKKLITDNVQIWEIVSLTVITTQDVMPFAYKLAEICKQEVQLIVINGMPYYVNSDPCESCTKKGTKEFPDPCELCEHTEGED